jgi:hypothetical protein
MALINELFPIFSVKFLRHFTTIVMSGENSNESVSHSFSQSFSQSVSQLACKHDCLWGKKGGGGEESRQSVDIIT